jgi:nicotinate phosphoribosyltransferase
MVNKTDTFVAERTDKYFTKSRQIAEKFGDRVVTYGVFQRRPTIAAPALAIAFLKEHCPEAEVIEHVEEGTIVEPQTKTLSIKAPLSKIVECETLFLQRLGFSQICAYNAYRMALALPLVPFLDMHGRHAAGDDMVLAAAYGASVGSRVARLQGAKGFIGTSNDLSASYYPTKKGLGTMPHAIIGYAGCALMDEWNATTKDHTGALGFFSADAYAQANGTLRATQMYVEANPDDVNIIALVDYYGQEVSDSIQCAKWFYEQGLDKQGKKFGVRLDTHGGRFLEGLDYGKSVEVVCDWLKVHPADEYAAVRRILGEDAYDFAGDDNIDKIRKLLFGTGVSAANVMYLRNQLNAAGFPDVFIVASSGFDLFKCQIMAKANTPISMVGTGSFLPKTMSESYATADIYRYDDYQTIKVGREWLYE